MENIIDRIRDRGNIGGGRTRGAPCLWWFIGGVRRTDVGRNGSESFEELCPSS